MLNSFTNEYSVIYNLEKHSLFWAIHNNDIEKLKGLMEAEENNIDILETKNIRGLTTLHYAVRFCNIDTLHFLLNKSSGKYIDILDEDKNTLLHTAININNPQKVQAIINHNPELKLRNNENLTPICLARQIKNLNHKIKTMLKEYIALYKKLNIVK
tara:strand:+ start:109 stop:579 length:471 start_codon:yes stop_codon:yes gene_type:complete